MRRCPLSEDLCGMTLARPVRNAGDAVLLARGVVLDARLIGVLKSLGVTHVTVERLRDDRPPTPEETAARRAIADREERRFGDIVDDPYMTALKIATIELKGSDWEIWSRSPAPTRLLPPAGDGAKHA